MVKAAQAAKGKIARPVNLTGSGRKLLGGAGHAKEGRDHLHRQRARQRASARHQQPVAEPRAGLAGHPGRVTILPSAIDLDDHIAAFRLAAERADLVIVTGGLGPTQDDLTREALAAGRGSAAARRPRLARSHRRHVRPAKPAHGRAEQGPGARARGRRGRAQSRWHRAGNLDAAGSRDRSPACLVFPPR